MLLLTVILDHQNSAALLTAASILTNLAIVFLLFSFPVSIPLFFSLLILGKANLYVVSQIMINLHKKQSI